jgi:8-oxo-dGTP pyrophosphatase MutT (NUDIX family)
MPVLHPPPSAARRCAQAVAAALAAELRAQWNAQAWQRPAEPRHALWAGAHCVGSVHPAMMNTIGLLRSNDGRELLQKTELLIDTPWADGWLHRNQGWQLASTYPDQWQALALALRDAGLHGPWRDEALAVVALEQGLHSASRLAGRWPEGTPDEPVGFVERAVVRVLGIATRAVHLIALTPDGDIWVQQRALTKANDPGKWDTTMGGMVGGHETWASALARETWEEAGLDLLDLDAPHAQGAVQFSMPSADAHGMGWMMETIAWTAAVLPAHAQPVNQDGEVAQFAAWTPREVAQALVAGAFTLEASCVLADWCEQLAPG